jgi:hypothetical protein
MLNGRLVNGRVEIPVVVNVLYNTAAENISLTQIQSQIGYADFNTNSDFNSTPYSLSCKCWNHVCFRSKQKGYSKSSWELEML